MSPTEPRKSESMSYMAIALALSRDRLVRSTDRTGKAVESKA